MTTVREIIAKHLTDNGFDGLAGDECGCALSVDGKDLFPCDSCPDECQPGYKWECGQCPGVVEEWCHLLYGTGGCYRTMRQEVQS